MALVDACVIVGPLASSWATPAPYTIVDEGLIAPHIEVSLLPNWIGGTQYRAARLYNSRVELSPPEPIFIHGQRRNATLIWRRT